MQLVASKLLKINFTDLNKATVPKTMRQTQKRSDDTEKILAIE